MLPFIFRTYCNITKLRIKPGSDHSDQLPCFSHYKGAGRTLGGLFRWSAALKVDSHGTPRCALGGKLLRTLLSAFSCRLLRFKLVPACLPLALPSEMQLLRTRPFPL